MMWIAFGFQSTTIGDVSERPNHTEPTEGGRLDPGEDAPAAVNILITEHIIWNSYASEEYLSHAH